MGQRSGRTSQCGPCGRPPGERLSKKFEQIAEHYYILNISNYPRAETLGPGPHAPEHSAEADTMLAGIGKRMKQTTFLRPTGKRAVQAEDIVILPAGDALLVLIFFPRTEPLTVMDKEVGFESSYQKIKVEVTFRLSEMVYQGRLGL
jgi:hypothetical protein